MVFWSAEIPNGRLGLRKFTARLLVADSVSGLKSDLLSSDMASLFRLSSVRFVL